MTSQIISANELAKELKQYQDQLPPVQQWNPDFSGDLDIRIARDGAWYYQGSLIAREAMVRLFARVLRHDEDGSYYLVTPVEKFRIQVEDAPFIAISAEPVAAPDPQLVFTTNLGDKVIADASHPIRVSYSEEGEPAPYVLVRDRLEALITRNLFYQLVEIAQPKQMDDGSWLGLESGGVFFPLGKIEE